MKPYTNKTDKVDERKCLYSEIKGNDKARKKAARRDAKKDIEDQLSMPVVSQQRELLKVFYLYINDKWALGMLTNKVDEVIEGFGKSL